MRISDNGGLLHAQERPGIAVHHEPCADQVKTAGVAARGKGGGPAQSGCRERARTFAIADGLAGRRRIPECTGNDAAVYADQAAHRSCRGAKRQRPARMNGRDRTTVLASKCAHAANCVGRRNAYYGIGRVQLAGITADQPADET